MKFPPEVSADEIERHFLQSLRACQRSEEPYRTWKMKEVLPLNLCIGILTLPICPAFLGKTDGTRGTYNDQRTYLNPTLRGKFDCCEAMAQAFQRPTVARALAETCDVEPEGGYLRIEYIQDIDGAWLEPHRDIPEKIFSLVIYLFHGPDSVNWGTDIYDHDVKWIGRASGEFDSGTIFIAGPHSWHGFEPRPLVGVRRLMEINYVRPNWIRREQLSFPDRPITLA
ncbi:hypothetical protein [Rhodopila globiformis]|uniref:2OG-Fe(II) oxygenase n=1 Tax=Rhodopila globiformis TaxID=1071 RepID=A0A2S6N3G5_RHOGL|nr:hypothetical protein [Rhodopila globiformis]PPQ29146.1 hypothetical protein CCS01_22400 [Rhodopila globiformis]